MSFKTLTVVALAAGTIGLCSAAYADSSTGFYVGGQAGYGKADYGNEIVNSFNSAPSHSVDESGVAGRVYAGYQFNQLFGVETGYSHFSNNSYKASGTILGQTVSIDATAKTQQVDILGKIGMPFGNSGFRGDIKGGAAYVISNVDASGAVNGTTIVTSSGSQRKWEPAAGASLSYNINKNFAVDVSYLHAFGSHNNNVNPSTDLATVGISYLFA